MSLVDDFAIYIGLPAWFVGGFIGLVVFYIALVVLSKYLKLPDFAATSFTITVCIVNVFLFYWPWYIALMAGILLLRQSNVIPSFAPDVIIQRG